MGRGVDPGGGERVRSPETVGKCRSLGERGNEGGLQTGIEIDGGVKINNAAECAAAGANVLVAGSVVFNDNASVADSMRDLREALAAVEREA